MITMMMILMYYKLKYNDNRNNNYVSTYKYQFSTMYAIVMAHAAPIIGKTL